MNIRAKQLGMNDTTFKNCNGLDEDGHLTTAHDVALMSAELIKHEKIFDYTLIFLSIFEEVKESVLYLMEKDGPRSCKKILLVREPIGIRATIPFC